VSALAKADSDGVMGVAIDYMFELEKAVKKTVIHHNAANRKPGLLSKMTFIHSMLSPIQPPLCFSRGHFTSATSGMESKRKCPMSFFGRVFERYGVAASAAK
jgi:hypothetical protein